MIVEIEEEYFGNKLSEDQKEELEGRNDKERQEIIMKLKSYYELKSV